MANKMQQNKNKVIEKLKSNLCMFVCKDPNYEYVSYTNQPASSSSTQQQQHQQYNDNLDVLLTPKLQTKSRTRLAIYYKSPTSAAQQSDDGESEDHYDTFNYKSMYKPKNANNDDYDEVPTNDQIPLHSTKINENIKSPNASKFPHLMMSADYTNKNKATSTFVYKILSASKDVLKNNDTPNLSEISMDLNNSSTGCSSQSSDETTSVIDDENELYEIGAIYSCYIPYQAQFDGDLTISFAERLQVIKDDGNDYILVKNLSTKAFGYVPRDHILPVNVFLANLV